MMFTVHCNFIGDFKLGDNINYNLKSLSKLYTYYAKETQADRGYLRKPIILILVSVTEAVLHDFHGRIREFTWEGVKNIPGSVMTYIQELTKIDKFEQYIDSARKHDFFDVKDTVFYDDMHELRRLRNRIHIQNEKRDFEREEYNAFTERRKVQAERVLEVTLKTMSRKYARGPEYKYVADFELPWPEHFPVRG